MPPDIFHRGTFCWHTGKVEAKKGKWRRNEENLQKDRWETKNGRRRGMKLRREPLFFVCFFVCFCFVLLLFLFLFCFGFCFCLLFYFFVFVLFFVLFIVCLFLFLFCFGFSLLFTFRNHWNLFGMYQNRKKFGREKAYFTPRKKIGKSDLALSENIPLTPLQRTSAHNNMTTWTASI